MIVGIIGKSGSGKSLMAQHLEVGHGFNHIRINEKAYELCWQVLFNYFIIGKDSLNSLFLDKNKTADRLYGFTDDSTYSTEKIILSLTQTVPEYANDKNAKLLLDVLVSASDFSTDNLVKLITYEWGMSIDEHMWTKYFNPSKLIYRSGRLTVDLEYDSWAHSLSMADLDFTSVMIECDRPPLCKNQEHQSQKIQGMPFDFAITNRFDHDFKKKIDSLKFLRKQSGESCDFCGGDIVGDGFTLPVHCEFSEVPEGAECDSGPYFCDQYGIL